MAWFWTTVAGRTVGALLSVELDLTSVTFFHIPMNAVSHLRVHRTVLWWDVLRNCEDFTICNLAGVGSEAYADLLKLPAVWRPRSSCIVASLPLVDLFSQMTHAKSVPRTLVIGARHIERVSRSTRGRPWDARVRSPRLDLGLLSHLVGVNGGRIAQAKRHLRKARSRPH